MFKFIKCDNVFKFDKYNSYIELVNGVRLNNVVFKRGDVEMMIKDLIGNLI